jgi:hypothetical protein
MTTQIDTLDEGLVNPLDSVEDILTANNWVFNRMTNHELMVQVAGKACEYRLFFIWQEDMSAMQFCCQYDMAIDRKRIKDAARAVMEINERLWMGHFDLPRDTGIPSFRHTCLLRGMTDPSGYDHIEDLVDIALAQCEQYFSVFHLLSRLDVANDQDLCLALLETSGEA